MTWFQLVQREEPESRPATRQPSWLVPNSAFFLNPAIVTRPKAEPETIRPRLRLLRPVR